MNKVLEMDFRGQTAVLSAFVLVGMMFLVPAITGIALAGIHATASGVCGPEGQTHPCEFTLVDKRLDKGSWTSEPTQSGTRVTWSTTGTWNLLKESQPAGQSSPAELIEKTTGCCKMPGAEEGSVTYKVGEETAVLSFENPVIGSNKCSISWYTPAHTLYYHSTKLCAAGEGQDAQFTYNLRSTPNFETCKELKATIAEDELANSAQWKNMQCESLLK